MQLKESLEGTEAWNASGIQEGTAVVGPDLSGRVKCRAGIVDGVEIVDFGGTEKIVGGTKDMI